MAKQKVDIVVAAKDQASGKLGGIAKAAIGMGAAFLTWRGLKAMVAGNLEAYNKQIEAETKLQQATVPCPTAYQEFVDAILDGREPIATGQHGLDVQLILDAIYMSAATGKEVRISKK